MNKIKNTPIKFFFIIISRCRFDSKEKTKKKKVIKMMEIIRGKILGNLSLIIIILKNVKQTKRDVSVKQSNIMFFTIYFLFNRKKCIVYSILITLQRTLKL